MKTTDFEKWLEDVCFEQNPMVLDDDMPDFFDDWIGNLSSEDFIAYANEYAKQDRHTIYTALREGIEELKCDDTCGSCDGTAVDALLRNGEDCPQCHGTGVDNSCYTQNYVLDQTLTLLDELFGVSK